MKTYVAYLRVANKQGINGLTAQEQAIKAYNGNVIDTFTEVESGRRKDRPELIKALTQCKLTGSTLIVAKLDRLARDVCFISSLMESKVDFVACDGKGEEMRKTIGWLNSQIERHGWIRISSEPSKIAGVTQTGIFDVVIEKPDGSRHTYYVYNPAAVA